MKLKYVFMACMLLMALGLQAQDYSKRKLGTHNSMTYMKPRTTQMLAMWPFAKCQSMTYTEQYDFGVRFFDLRIRFIDGKLILRMVRWNLPKWMPIWYWTI